MTSRITLTLTASTCLLLAATAFAADQEGKWEAQAALGANLTSGNSDTVQMNADLGASRKSSAHELALGAAFAYGETESDTTEKNGKATAQYNWLFSPRTYTYLNAEGEYDPVANLDYRVTAGPGLGHYLVKSDSQSLSLELGAAFINEQKVINGEEEADDKVTLRAKQHYEATIGDNAKLWESVEYLPDVEDTDVYLLNAECGILAAINSTLSLRLSALNKYDSDAAPTIEKNDLAIKAALVYQLK